MADLVFVQQPTQSTTAAWLVRDAGDRLLGSIEWHDLTGSFGFAPTEVGAGLFTGTYATQIGAFLWQVNAQSEGE